MSQISILGCGWLGFPLAKALVEKGYVVKGSTTTSEKIAKMEINNIEPFLFNLNTQSIPDIFADFLKGSEILIIAIPPKLRGKNKDYSEAPNNSFVKKITNLLPCIEQNSVKKLLFISSTAIYGEANDVVDEFTLPIPATESGKQLLEIENILLANPHFKTTVLRFGGLIGEDRNPARFLAGKVNVPNPEAPINLIHLTDCIAIMLQIIEKNIWDETFNAVAPIHPSRKVYYTQKAIESNFSPPEFNHDEPSVGKTILADKLEKTLNFTFKITQL